MATMKAMRIPEPNAELELVEVGVPEPAADQVLVKVEACGVCHGDTMAVGGMASAYPRIPGHEVVGTVEKTGSESCPVKVGQRVGIAPMIEEFKLEQANEALAKMLEAKTKSRGVLVM